MCEKFTMKSRGFTLIEVLVSATIISVLTAIGVVSYTNINKRSRDTKRKSDMEQIRSALEMYRADNGWYPSTGAPYYTDASNLSSDLVSSYMSAIPVDPKNASPSVYKYKATNPSGGKYYGYCLSALLESEDPSDTCTPWGTQNYGVKNP